LGYNVCNRLTILKIVIITQLPDWVSPSLLTLPSLCHARLSHGPILVFVQRRVTCYLIKTVLGALPILDLMKFSAISSEGKRRVREREGQGEREGEGGRKEGGELRVVCVTGGMAASKLEGLFPGRHIVQCGTIGFQMGVFDDEVDLGNERDVNLSGSFLLSPFLLPFPPSLPLMENHSDQKRGS
jgi:hypothetical protein